MGAAGAGAGAGAGLGQGGGPDLADLANSPHVQQIAQASTSPYEMSVIC